MRQAAGFSHSVDIPADPEEVFWALLESSRANELDSNFDYWRPCQWPPFPGTQNDFKANVGGLSMKGVSSFAEFDPPRHLILESMKPTFPMLVRMSWDLEPIADGTHYTYRMEVDAAPGFGWLARGMAARYDKQIVGEVPELASLF